MEAMGGYKAGWVVAVKGVEKKCVKGQTQTIAFFSRAEPLRVAGLATLSRVR